MLRSIGKQSGESLRIYASWFSPPSCTQNSEKCSFSEFYLQYGGENSWSEITSLFSP